MNLRWAFALFLAWLGTLVILGRLGMGWYSQGQPLGLAVWILAIYMFYLSMCCTFFPAPTSWIIMLAASDYMAQMVGLEQSVWARVAVVSVLGAIATAVANLNEYHILTFMLRYRRAGAIRDTRFYRAAQRWFSVSPFAVLTVFSLIPIPVDVVRWLAVADRYPRSRFFAAYFIGRLVRYAVLAGSTIGLALGPWHIGIVQLVLVALAAAKMLPRLLKSGDTDSSEEVDHSQPEEGVDACGE